MTDNKETHGLCWKKWHLDPKSSNPKRTTASFRLFSGDSCLSFHAWGWAVIISHPPRGLPASIKASLAISSWRYLPKSQAWSRSGPVRVFQWLLGRWIPGPGLGGSLWLNSYPLCFLPSFRLPVAFSLPCRHIISLNISYSQLLFPP